MLKVIGRDIPWRKDLYQAIHETHCATNVGLATMRTIAEHIERIIPKEFAYEIHLFGYVHGHKLYHLPS